MNKLKLKPATRNQLALMGALLDKVNKVYGRLPDVEREVLTNYFSDSFGPGFWLILARGAVKQALTASKPQKGKAKFHRKIYLFDTVSEDSLDGMDLECAMVNAATEGNVGVEDETIEIKMNGAEAVELLYDMGSEPGFFGLNDEGKSVR